MFCTVRVYVCVREYVFMRGLSRDEIFGQVNRARSLAKDEINDVGFALFSRINVIKGAYCNVQTESGLGSRSPR